MDLHTIGELHGVIFFLVAAGVVYSDHQGYLYFKGKKALLSETFISWSHKLIWLGLVLMIITGVFLTIPSWELRLQDPVFYVKMGLVLVLIMNAVAIGSLSKLAAATPYAQLSNEAQRTLTVSAALSFMGWVGAAAIGLFFL